jgi:hypothetical protein
VFAAAFAPAALLVGGGALLPEGFPPSPASMPAMTSLLIQGFQFNNGLQVVD